MSRRTNNQRYNITISAELSPHDVTILKKMKNINSLVAYLKFDEVNMVNVLVDDFEQRREVLTAHRNQNRDRESYRESTSTSNFTSNTTPAPRRMPLNNNTNITSQVRKISKFETKEGFRTLFVWNLPGYMSKQEKEDELRNYFEKFGEIFSLNVHGKICGHIVFKQSESLDKMFQSGVPNYGGNPFPLEVNENTFRPTDYTKYYPINLRIGNREVKIHRAFPCFMQSKEYYAPTKIIRISDVKWSMQQGGLTMDKIANYFQSHCGKVKAKQHLTNRNNPDDQYVLIEFLHCDSADKAILIGDRQNISEDRNGVNLKITKDFSRESLTTHNQIIGLDQCASDSLLDNRLKRSLEDSINLSDDEANCTITRDTNEQDTLGEQLGLIESDTINNNITFRKRAKIEQESAVIKEEINRTLSQDEDDCNASRVNRSFIPFNENLSYEFYGDAVGAPTF
jgi:hypothetical protein